MTGRQEFTITDTNRADLVRLVADAIRSAPAGHMLTVAEEGRTLLQNKKLWPMLTDISRQVSWDGEALEPIEWKDFLTAALRQQRMVRGWDHRTIVFVGKSTREMGKAEFCDLIELIYAFGGRKHVIWSERSQQNFAELRQAP